MGFLDGFLSGLSAGVGGLHYDDVPCVGGPHDGGTIPTHGSVNMGATCKVYERHVYKLIQLKGPTWVYVGAVPAS